MQLLDQPTSLSLLHRQGRRRQDGDRLRHGAGAGRRRPASVLLVSTDPASNLDEMLAASWPTTPAASAGRAWALGPEHRPRGGGRGLSRAGCIGCPIAGVGRAETRRRSARSSRAPAPPRSQPSTPSPGSWPATPRASTTSSSTPRPPATRSGSSACPTPGPASSRATTGVPPASGRTAGSTLQRARFEQRAARRLGRSVAAWSPGRQRSTRAQARAHGGRAAGAGLTNQRLVRQRRVPCHAPGGHGSRPALERRRAGRRWRRLPRGAGRAAARRGPAAARSTWSGFDALREPSRRAAAPPPPRRRPRGRCRGCPALAALVDELAAPGMASSWSWARAASGKTTHRRGRGAGPRSSGALGASHHHRPARASGAHARRRGRGLTVDRIDPAAETARYVEKIMATKRPGSRCAGPGAPARGPALALHRGGRRLPRLLADRGRGARPASSCSTPRRPGTRLLLMDAAASYHRQILRDSQQSAQAKVVTPLMRLQDPAYTKVLLVTLAETTPVSEAAALQADLRRARIEPWAWVVNQSLAAASTRRPGPRPARGGPSSRRSRGSATDWRGGSRSCPGRPRSRSARPAGRAAATAGSLNETPAVVLKLSHPSAISRAMETTGALAALAALAHETRLAVFRLLVTHRPERSAGRRDRRADRACRPLRSRSISRSWTDAGLLRSWRLQRQISTPRDYEGTRQLLTFLTPDCCQRPSGNLRRSAPSSPPVPETRGEVSLPWPTRSTTSSSSAPAIRPAASWPSASSIAGARAASWPTPPAASPRAGCTP